MYGYFPENKKWNDPLYVWAQRYGPAEPGAVLDLHRHFSGADGVFRIAAGDSGHSLRSTAVAADAVDLLPHVFQKPLQAAGRKPEVGKLVVGVQKPQSRSQRAPCRQGPQVFYLQKLQDHLSGAGGQREDRDHLPEMRRSDPGQDLTDMKKPSRSICSGTAFFAEDLLYYYIIITQIYTF